MKALTDVKYPDPATIRAKARDDWEKRERGRLSVQERIGASVPWWLVAVAAVFYALSSQHTAAVFDMLTPGWGWAAPIGVEFGLLYAAFRRKQLGTANKRTPWTLIGMEFLLFIIAILVNGAGALSAVLSATGLETLPFQQIWDGFTRLPAIHQVALPLVVMAAVVIPLGTVAAGEGMASLFLERQTVSSALDEAWREDGPRIEYEALRDAAVAAGFAPRRAAAWADGIVRDPDTARTPIVISTPDTRPHPPTDAKRTPPALLPGQPEMSVTDEFISAAVRVRAYLADNPDAASLSVRKLADAAGVGKTVAADELRRYRAAAQTDDAE